MHYYYKIRVIEALRAQTAFSTKDMSAGYQMFLSVLPLLPNYNTSEDQLVSSFTENSLKKILSLSSCLPSQSGQGGSFLMLFI